MFDVLCKMSGLFIPVSTFFAVLPLSQSLKDLQNTLVTGSIFTRTVSINVIYSGFLEQKFVCRCD